MCPEFTENAAKQILRRALSPIDDEAPQLLNVRETPSFKAQLITTRPVIFRNQAIHVMDRNGVVIAK